MKPPPKKDLFDEIAELVPPQHLDNYWRLVARLRRLDPHDEILLVVWGIFLCASIIAGQCEKMVTVLRGMQAANSYFEDSITKAGLGIFYRNKGMSQTGSVTSTDAAPSPATTPPVSTPLEVTSPPASPPLEDRERKDLVRWMRIIFVMLLVLTGSLLAFVRMFENVLHSALSH